MYYRVLIEALVATDGSMSVSDLEKDCFSLNADSDPGVDEMVYKVIEVKPITGTEYIREQFTGEVTP